MNSAVDLEKFKEIPFKQRDCCMICGQKMREPVIALSEFPITEIYTNQRPEKLVGYVDQGFHFCPHCGQGQLANVIDVDLQYKDTFSYFFRTSESATAKTSSDFFLEFLNRVVVDRSFQHIIELGCNDLYVLKALKDRASHLTGIDPILKDEKQEGLDEKISAIGDFFENVDDLGDFDLVICKDTLEHVSDPKNFVKKVIEKSSPETTFLFQFPLFEELLGGCRFDQVFHQHVNYFSLKSILFMLEELGCELIDYEVNHSHWGAVMVAFQKSFCQKESKARSIENVWNISEEDILKRYAIFQADMKNTNERLLSLSRERIYGYGAALMLPVLSYHLGNDFSSLECIIDDDSRKEGLFYINLGVAIKARKAIADLGNSVFLVTAISSMNNVRAILPKLFELKPKQILLPLSSI